MSKYIRVEVTARATIREYWEGVVGDEVVDQIEAGEYTLDDVLTYLPMVHDWIVGDEEGRSADEVEVYEDYRAFERCDSRVLSLLPDWTE